MIVARTAHSIRGVYAVTPDASDTRALAAKVAAAISGGARIIQYRNKTASTELRLQQAHALRDVCSRARAALIVNDHVDLAVAVHADGVHLGRDDTTVERARAVLGPSSIIGVSCYNELARARKAQADGADYVAFGSFFASSVKPDAVRAPLDVLVNAKRELSVPIVAIGGITVDNAHLLVSAGADALAIVASVFGAPNVESAARELAAVFRSNG